MKMMKLVRVDAVDDSVSPKAAVLSDGGLRGPPFVASADECLS